MNKTLLLSLASVIGITLGYYLPIGILYLERNQVIFPVFFESLFNVILLIAICVGVYNLLKAVLTVEVKDNNTYILHFLQPSSDLRKFFWVLKFVGMSVGLVNLFILTST